MQAKRIIACVRVTGSELTAGVMIAGLGSVRGPVEAAEALENAGADEIHLIDASATRDGRKLAAALVKTVTQRITIPLVAGGGVAGIEDFREIIQAGAARVILNTAAVENSEVLSEASQEFGSERVVLGMDARNEGAGWTVHTRAGTKNTHIDAITWGQEAEAQGAGEILLMSLDRAGTGEGFDVDLTHAVSDEIEIPVIAAGGAASAEHFAAILGGGRIAGASSASAFCSGRLGVRQVKDFLKARGIEVRPAR